MQSIKLTFCGLVLAMLSSLGVASTAAPDFTLKSNSGSNLRLQEYRGQVVLVNFWASWCGPCRTELPALNALQTQFQDLGFTVLGVNVDQQKGEADKLLQQIPVNFPVLYDSENKVSEMYNVVAMPTTVIVDKNGNVRHLHRSYKPGYEDKYAAQIKELIKEF